MRLSIVSFWLIIFSGGNFAWPQEATTPPPELSAQAQAMIDNRHTDPLDTIASSCRRALTQQAPHHCLPMEFYPAEIAGRQRAILTELLERTADEIATAQAQIDALNRYLDWYPNDDWHKQFAETGFYDRLQQHQLNFSLFRCLLVYYRGCLERCSGATEPADPNISACRLAELQQALQTISGLLGPQDSPVVRLWQIRLSRLLSFYDPSQADRTQQFIRDFLAAHSSAQWQFEARWEALRYQVELDPKNTAGLTGPFQKLRDWMAAHSTNLPDYPEKQLQVALFELKVTAGRNSLEVFRHFAAQYPSLKSAVNEIIVGYAADEFAASAHGDQPAARLNDTEVFLLIDYYQSCRPPRWHAALRVYESFLRTRPPENPHTPQVLFDLAQCHYQLAQDHLQTADVDDPQANIPADPSVVTDHTLAAIEYWHRLARKFPQWSSPSDPQQIHARKAALWACQVVCHLFTDDPEHYTTTALTVFPALAGQLEPGQSVPSGPFADSAAIVPYRYYYALALQRDGQYDRAAAMFDAVPAHDPHKLAARYNAVYCRYNHYQNTSAASDSPAKITPPALPEANAWSAELTSLIQDAPADPIVIAATLLLAQLAQQPNQQMSAAQMVMQTARHHPGVDELHWAALNLFQQLRPELFQLHANNSRQELSAFLSGSIDLLDTIYHSLQERPQEDRFGVLLRTYLEHLALWAVTATDRSGDSSRPLELLPAGNHLQTAEKLILQAEKIADWDQTVWLMRVRALVAYARGDFEQSQQFWHRIRGSTGNSSDPVSQYYWWEARYFGFCCLSGQNEADQTAHGIDVLLRSGYNYTGPWRERLKTLRQKALNGG